MAISTPASLAHAFQTSASDDTPVTASVTFTSGRLYLFVFEIDRSSPPDLSTGFSFTHGATDRTASWTFIRTQLFGTPRAMAVYWYVAGTTETVALTYNAPGTGANCYAYNLIEIASGFNAASPIVQSNGANGTSVASISVTLGAAPTSGNLEMSFVGSRAASGAITPRTNWTELTEDVGSGTTGNSGGLEVQYVFDPNLETTASASASGNRTWGIIALEIAAASGTTFNSTLSGAISPGATLANKTTKVLDGAISPAGALVKQTMKVLAGALSPSGALASVKVVIKTLAGALTPGTGDLATTYIPAPPEAEPGKLVEINAPTKVAKLV